MVFFEKYAKMTDSVALRTVDEEKVMAIKKKKKQVKTAMIKKTIKKLAKKSVKRSLKKVSKQSVKKSAKKSIQKTAPKKPVTKSVKQPVKKTTKIQVVKKLATAVMRQPSMVETKYLSEEMAINEDDALTTPRKAKTLLGALEFTPYQPEAGETYMSEKQRVHFQNILGAWKQQLMQDVDATVGHLKEDAVFYADPVDRASQEEGFTLELRTRDRERRLIKKIEQSLDLLNVGDYGYCEDCGAEIGIRRLEARPTAVKCIDCKTFQEIREKQLGGS